MQLVFAFENILHKDHYIWTNFRSTVPLRLRQLQNIRFVWDEREKITGCQIRTVKRMTIVYWIVWSVKNLGFEPKSDSSHCHDKWLACSFPFSVRLWRLPIKKYISVISNLKFYCIFIPMELHQVTATSIQYTKNWLVPFKTRRPTLF